MAKNPAEMAAAMRANMKEKTGKTCEQWLAIVKKTKLGKHGEIVTHLKTQHGLTHGYASMVAYEHLATGTLPPTDNALIDTQYSGTKEPLRPIYDALVAKIAKFGTDVEIAPKKAYVSLRRSKQFALIRPSTRTRVDVGINLKAKDPTQRLEASGSFNSMVTHRVRLESPKDIDAQLIAWLKEAYRQA